MNFLQHIYPGDTMASFVIRVLAEITLVTVTAFLLARLIARKNPALRHGICVCALLFVVTAPITTLGLEQLGWSTFSIRLESEKQALTTVAIPYGERVVSIATDRTHPFWTLERARDAASLIILVWALGTGVLLSRLMNGSRKVRALRSSAREIDDPKLNAALASVGFQARAPIRFSRRLHSPVVVGPRDTTVILPEKLLAQLDEDQLRCVLAHELTHVRQRDPLIGLIQRLVEAGYWPHPMVHVLNRDLVRAREEVCDNAALTGTTAPQYADTLLTVALGMSPQHATLGIGLMTKKWRLEERVKGLLDPQRRLTTTMNTRHLAFVLVALAAGTAIIAGAHIVAAPNPPSLQQQSLDLYSHYNPNTKKVTVSSKLTQLKLAKKAKATSASVHSTGTWNVLPKGDVVRVKYAPAGTWNVLPKGQRVRVRYEPDDANLFQVNPKGQEKGVLQIIGEDGKTQSIQLDTVKSAPTLKNDAVIQVTGSADVAKDWTVLSDKLGATYTIQSDAKVKGDDQPVTITTTTTKDGKTETITTTTDKVPVLSDVPVIGKLFRYQVTTDNPKLKTITVDATGSVVAQKETQSNDTIVLTQKDGVVYLQAQDPSKRPAITFTAPRIVQSRQPAVTYVTPPFKLDVRAEPQVRLYYSDPAKPLVKSDRLKWTQVQPRLYTIKPDVKYKAYNLYTTPKSSQTTVYIDGDHIRVVGDSIKVVHVDSAKARAKKSIKPKSK